MPSRVRLAGLLCASLLGCGPKDHSESAAAELHFTIPNTRGATEDLVLDRFLLDGGAPLYVRSGTMLPKIPEDVMTLVPANEYADQRVKSIDNRRVYEIYPGAKLESIQDFEGRTISPGDQAGTLTIAGAPAHIILRWRFAGPRTVMINGRAVPARRTADGASVEFDHSESTTLRWQ